MLMHFLSPLFSFDNSAGEFHADLESYRNLGLKINRNEVIPLFTIKVL